MRTFRHFILVRITRNVNTVARTRQHVTSILFTRNSTNVGRFRQFITVGHLRSQLRRNFTLRRSLRTLDRSKTIRQFNRMHIKLVLRNTRRRNLTNFNNSRSRRTFVTSRFLSRRIFRRLLAILLTVTRIGILGSRIVQLLPARPRHLFANVDNISVLSTRFSRRKPSKTTRVQRVVSSRGALLIVQRRQEFPNGLEEAARGRACSFTHTHRKLTGNYEWDERQPFKLSTDDNILLGDSTRGRLLENLISTRFTKACLLCRLGILLHMRREALSFIYLYVTIC